MKNIPLTENEIKEIKDHYSQELERIQKRTIEIQGILQKFESSKSNDNSKVEKIAETPKSKRKVQKKAAVPAITSTVKEPAKAETIATLKKGRKKGAVKVKVSAAKAEKAVKSSKPAKAVVKAKKVVEKPSKTKKTVAVKAVKKAVKTAVKSTAAGVKNAKAAKKDVVVSKKGRKKSTDSKKAHYEAYLLNLLSKQGKLLTSKAIFDSVEKEFKVTAADYTKMKATVTVILSKEKAGGKIKDITQPGTKAKLYGMTEWFDDKGNLKDSSKLK